MATDFLHGVETVTVERGPRHVQTVRSSVIGVIGTAPAADAAKFPLDTPVLVTGPQGFAGIGATGTLPKALNAIYSTFPAFVVVVRVNEGADAAATKTNIIGGIDTTTGALEGVHAFRAAESVLGVSPMLLIAPGFTGDHQADGGDAVVNALNTQAERLRAHAIVTGPSTTDTDAINFREGFSSRRIFVVDPKVNGGDDPAPLVAALIAKTDHTEGFWQSPSNRVLDGVVKVDRPIDFALGDANTSANLLNENEVATIIRDDGFRLWGNRTCSDDPKWAFLSVSRTADMVDLSIMKAHRWAVDRAITKGYFDDVSGSVNAYLRNLEARGAILGGKCWVDPDFNTPTDISGGRATFSYDFTPPSPAERVTFRSSVVDDYVSNLFAAS